MSERLARVDRLWLGSRPRSQCCSVLPDPTSNRCPQSSSASELSSVTTSQFPSTVSAGFTWSPSTSNRSISLHASIAPMAMPTVMATGWHPGHFYGGKGGTGMAAGRGVTNGRQAAIGCGPESIASLTPCALHGSPVCL